MKLTDLEKFPFRLVKGGQPTFGSGGLRCREMPSKLEPFESNETQFHPDTVIAQLEELTGLDVNIVGTRDYVYYTSTLLGYAKCEHVTSNNFRWNIFPRAGGLREALMEHYNAVDKEKWF